jgi:ketosteroid isomerase-like protein
MSQENVEVVRKLLDAGNQRDPDAFIALLRPDVEWDDSAGFPGLRGIYRGRAEARGWFDRAVLEIWDQFHIRTEEITDAGDDRVLVELLLTTRGRTSGVETELRVWFILWLTDRQIARRQLFWTSDEALEAAGLSE